MFPSGSRRLGEFSRPAGARFCVSVGCFSLLPLLTRQRFGYRSVASRVASSTDLTLSPLGLHLLHDASRRLSCTVRHKGTAEVVVTMLAAAQKV